MTDVNRMQAVENYSRDTVAALCDALERSETLEHFVYREAELDDLWRVVDTALAAARRDTRKRAEAAQLERLLELVQQAHDFVGSDEAPLPAAARLRIALSLTSASS